MLSEIKESLGYRDIASKLIVVALLVIGFLGAVHGYRSYHIYLLQTEAHELVNYNPGYFVGEGMPSFDQVRTNLTHLIDRYELDVPKDPTGNKYDITIKKISPGRLRVRLQGKAEVLHFFGKYDIPFRIDETTPDTREYTGGS